MGEETAPARRGQLATAAGKCEGSETTLQCAVREAAEEFQRVVRAACTAAGGREHTMTWRSGETRALTVRLGKRNSRLGLSRRIRL